MYLEPLRSLPVAHQPPPLTCALSTRIRSQWPRCARCFIGDQFRLMSPQKTGGLTLMHGKKCTPLHAPLVSVEDRVTVSSDRHVPTYVSIIT